MIRFTHIVVKYGGQLAALASDGSLWEQFREQGSRELTWRRIAMAGIDASRRYVSLAADNGILVAVNSTGQVFRQAGDGRLGSTLHWLPVSLDGVAA